MRTIWRVGGLGVVGNQMIEKEERGEQVCAGHDSEMRKVMILIGTKVRTRAACLCV